MNYITRIIRVILELFNWYFDLSSTKTTPERNRDLDYIDICRSEIERNKAFDAKIEAQRRERYAETNNSATMDEI